MEKERKKRAPRKAGEPVISGTAVEKREEGAAAEPAEKAGKPGTVIELSVMAEGDAAAGDAGKNPDTAPGSSAGEAQETTAETPEEPQEGTPDSPVKTPGT